nr:MAG TPA: hypothetical protein [Caudoviricetes sp.]
MFTSFRLLARTIVLSLLLKSNYHKILICEC